MTAVPSSTGRNPSRLRCAAAWLTCCGCSVPMAAVALEPFMLRNDVGETARFDFLGTGLDWRGRGPLVPPKWVQPGRQAEVSLPDRDTVAFRYTTLNNRASSTILWQPQQALASINPKPVTVTFKGISERMVTEERTRTMSVTKQVPETRTKKVTVTKYRDEQRVRKVAVRDPATGRVTYRDERYTVRVPYTEEVEQTFTVNVPIMEQKTQTYTVQVPMSEAVFDIGGTAVTAPVLFAAGGDGPRRILGVTLGDVNGALVTGVDAGSPATRMRLFGPDADENKRYALEPNVDRIVRINGSAVRTGAEVAAAVQKSPATCIVTVSNRTGEETFEVELEPAAENDAPAPGK